jgi:hypothetical protein
MGSPQDCPIRNRELITLNENLELLRLLRLQDATSGIKALDLQCLLTIRGGGDSIANAWLNHV